MVLNARPGIFGHEVGGRIPNQLGGCIAVYQFCPLVDLQDDRRGHGQVGDEDADGHIFEQVAVALLASLVPAIGLVSHHVKFIPST